MCESEVVTTLYVKFKLSLILPPNHKRNIRHYLLVLFSSPTSLVACTLVQAEHKRYRFSELDSLLEMTSPRAMSHCLHRLQHKRYANKVLAPSCAYNCRPRSSRQDVIVVILSKTGMWVQQTCTAYFSFGEPHVSRHHNIILLNLY